MSSVAAPPIVPVVLVASAFTGVAVKPGAMAAGLVARPPLAPPTARVEGNVVRVDRRGKQIFCFEGVGLHKLGRGEVATVRFGDATYRGELIAIAPTRAILHISNARADHGVAGE